MKRDIETQIVEDIFAGSQAWENLLVLADDIGSRMAGSPGEAAARDFLVQKLKEYGLDEVKVEAFPNRAWHAVREELSVVAPVMRPIICRCAGLSPSTQGEGLEAEVVFLERCDREELQVRQSEVAGRMVVAPYYPVPRQLKMPLAAEYGAVALLEARSAVGGLQPARTCSFARRGDIPTASISREDAAYLQRLQQRKGPVRLRLVLDSRIEMKDSWNVVGHLRGSDEGSEHIVLGGHYDSWHVGPGAIDNATGVVAVLEAARGLALYKSHLRRSLRFVFFGVEEMGLVGSWAYTRAHAEELDGAILMVNNDVGGRPVHLSSAGFAGLCPELERIAARVRVKDAAGPMKVSSGNPGWASDHFPFVATGVPTMGLGCEMVRPDAWPYAHTRADTADKVYAEGLTECAAINAQIAFTFSNLPARPESRRSRQEVEAMLDEYALRETLDLLDIWPPERVMQRYFEQE